MEPVDAAKRAVELAQAILIGNSFENLRVEGIEEQTKPVGWRVMLAYDDPSWKPPPAGVATGQEPGPARVFKEVYLNQHGNLRKIKHITK